MFNCVAIIQFPEILQKKHAQHNVYFNLGLRLEIAVEYKNINGSLFKIKISYNLFLYFSQSFQIIFVGLRIKLKFYITIRLLIKIIIVGFKIFVSITNIILTAKLLKKYRKLK